jgi:hypothetical protein
MLEDVCQWDASAAKGRQCTVKPAVINVFSDVFKCEKKSASHPGGTAPHTEADCTRIGPWCEFEVRDNGEKHCDAEDDDDTETGKRGFFTAMNDAGADVPTDITPFYYPSTDEQMYVAIAAVCVCGLLGVGCLVK